MNKYVKLIAMIVAIMSILCACGKSKEPLETTTDATATTAETNEVPIINLEMVEETTEAIVEETVESTEAAEAEHEYFTNDYGTYRRVNERVRTEGNVYLRSAPNGKKVVSVNMNVALTRIGVGEENGWSIVLYKDEEVYVPTYYVSPEENAKYKEVDEVVYTTQEVNFRNGPSIRCKNLGKFMKNSALTRIGIGEDGWSKIKYKDEIVYVYSQYLETRGNNSETEPVEATISEDETITPVENTMPVETEPKEEVLVSELTHYEEVLVSELTHYEEDGVIYEVVDETVEAARTVNIREKPTTKSDKVGELPGAKTIQRVGIGDNGWSKVIYKGHTAYIKSEYLLGK